MRASRPTGALASFLVGCLVMLALDTAVARIFGVLLIFAGVLLGVAAIATPEFLADDRDGSTRSPVQRRRATPSSNGLTDTIV